MLRLQPRTEHHHLHRKRHQGWELDGALLMISPDPSRSIPNPLSLHALRYRRRQRQAWLRARAGSCDQSPKRETARNNSNIVRTPHSQCNSHQQARYQILLTYDQIRNSNARRRSAISILDPRDLRHPRQKPQTRRSRQRKIAPERNGAGRT